MSANSVDHILYGRFSKRTGATIINSLIAENDLNDLENKILETLQAEMQKDLESEDEHKYWNIQEIGRSSGAYSNTLTNFTDVKAALKTLLERDLVESGTYLPFVRAKRID